MYLKSCFKKWTQGWQKRSRGIRERADAREGRGTANAFCEGSPWTREGERGQVGVNAIYTMTTIAALLAQSAYVQPRKGVGWREKGERNSERMRERERERGREREEGERELLRHTGR